MKKALVITRTEKLTRLERMLAPVLFVVLLVLAAVSSSVLS